MDVDWDAEGNTYVLSSGPINLQTADIPLPIPGAFIQYPPTPVEFQQHYDLNIMQLDANANLLWRTCLAGPNNEYAAACAVDRGTGQLMIADTTMTANTSAPDACTAAAGGVELPLCGNGGQFLQVGLNSNNTQGILVQSDGLIAQFDLAQRALVWSTYFGGLGADGIMDMKTNGTGDVYIVGYSRSSTYSTITCAATDGAPGFPSCDGNGGYFNPVPSGRKFFIARFGNGNTLKWCTRFGDTNPFDYEDSQLCLAIDEEKRPVVFGTTVYANSSFVQPLEPTILSDAYNRTTHNDENDGPKADCFVGMFNLANELIYAAYFGGVGNDLAGAVEAFDDRIYIGGSVYAGLNFPTHEPVIFGRDPYLDAIPSASATVPDAFLAQLRYDFTVGFGEYGGRVLNRLLLYPNPTNGTLNVTFPDGINSGVLEVSDGLGRCVLRQPVSGAGTQLLNLGQLAHGSYSVTLQSVEGSVTNKVFKTW